VEAIQKTVLEATAESAGQAEKKWQHAAHSQDMCALSAAPAINVKPVGDGVGSLYATSRALTNVINYAQDISGRYDFNSEEGCARIRVHL
jgi:hypothetical protein